MVNSCYRLANVLFQKYIESGKNKFYNLLFTIVFYFTRIFLCIVFNNFDNVEKKIKKHSSDFNKKIIVSMTSYGTRINTVWKTIATIMLQSLRASKIILWLAENEFKSEDELPETLKRLKPYGLEIRFCEDLKSHKKYYFALKEQGENLIVTFDDDMYYPNDIIKKLYEMHLKFPDDVISVSCTKMGESIYTPPSQWSYAKKRYVHSERLFYAYSGSGTMYPPGSLDKRAFDIQSIKELSYSEDDYWVKIMEDLKGVKVTQIEEIRPFPITIEKMQTDGLFLINKSVSVRNNCWNSLVNRYYKI